MFGSDNIHIRTIAVNENLIFFYCKLIIFERESDKICSPVAQTSLVYVHMQS